MGNIVRGFYPMVSVKKKYGQYHLVTMGLELVAIGRPLTVDCHLLALIIVVVSGLDLVVINRSEVVTIWKA